MWLQRSGSAAFVLLVIFFFMPKSAGGRTRENDDDDDASFADMATETTLDGCAAGYQLLKLVGYE